MDAYTKGLLRIVLENALIVIAGGTTESREAAEALAEQGYRVLLSQATDAPFQVEAHPRISLRTGRLTDCGWEGLLIETGAAAIVDAAHPHAVGLRATLRRVSAQSGVPLLRLERARVIIDSSALVVHSHAAAAQIACQSGQPVLVTVGTRQLRDYVSVARIAQVALYARVLDGAESREVLAELGCDMEMIIFGRGPFSVEVNLRHLQMSGARVLVTKDSGKAGGLAEKFEAARRCGCQVVVVARPPEAADALHSVKALVNRLRGLVALP
jgi:precorrin-6A/cobalt-precorrin-6A reductase